MIMGFLDWCTSSLSCCTTTTHHLADVILMLRNRFDLSPEQILSALASPNLAIEPVPDVELPQHLVDPQEIEATMEVRGVI
jgi:hypothetical protein